jgi:hypothetical protein
VWGREVDGLILTFHLAGINNQNFLMRDEETGTYWQQISGRAISGRLAGKQLKRIASDELSFPIWKAERPSGTILLDVPAFSSQYAPPDWDTKMKSTPTVIEFREHGLSARDLMLGIRAFGEARAWPVDLILREKLIEDRVGGKAVILVVGPDHISIRAFLRPASHEFYRVEGEPAADSAVMIDSADGSKWNFQGCAVGEGAGKHCLERLQGISDYWFDWRNYNPDTTVYLGAGGLKK